MVGFPCKTLILSKSENTIVYIFERSFIALFQNSGESVEVSVDIVTIVNSEVYPKVMIRHDDFNRFIDRSLMISTG